MCVSTCVCVRSLRPICPVLTSRSERWDGRMMLARRLHPATSFLQTRGQLRIRCSSFVSEFSLLSFVFFSHLCPKTPKFCGRATYRSTGGTRLAVLFLFLTKSKALFTAASQHLFFRRLFVFSICHLPLSFRALASTSTWASFLLSPSTSSPSLSSLPRCVQFLTQDLAPRGSPDEVAIRQIVTQQKVEKNNKTKNNISEHSFEITNSQLVTSSIVSVSVRSRNSGCVQIFNRWQFDQ